MSRILCALIVAGLWCVALPTRAAVVTFDYTFEFSGAFPPAGAAPWLRTTFDDGGGSGSVDLTFTALNLTGSEFARFSLFNLDPALDPTSLIFSAPTKTGVFADPVVSKGVNAFMADGDGFFDIELTFANAPPADRFDAGESVKYTITGIGSLTANSFNFNSASGGGQGTFPAAAHVQGIGAQGMNSGWVSVPEPAGLGLLGCAGLALLRRRGRA